MMTNKSNTTDSRPPLLKMTMDTPTELWNDSCSVSELQYSLNNGATGATCNPVIVWNVLRQEWNDWKDVINDLIRMNPEASEDELAWMLIEKMSVKAAILLEPVFQKGKGKFGRLSIQTDPRLYRNASAIVDQAVRFNSLAPNMIVKIPATRAGIVAIEEATYRGVSINATVSFTLAQAIEVAESVERGLRRREAEGFDISEMGPVCTLMVGRLDDWLRVVADKGNIIANPHVFDWAGVAVMKKTYGIFKDRGYRLKLLSAAFRNHLHWSEFIGGNVIISPPYQWQKRYNSSDIEIIDRISVPVKPEILEELEEKFTDFRRAYYEDGLVVSDFDGFGATVATLDQFCQATSALIARIREMMLVSPV